MTFDQQEQDMSRAVTPVPQYLSEVYKAISAVMATLAKQGISKDRKNEQQGYKFRGIDEVYNALSSALVAAGLVIIPSFKNRQCVERTTAKGNAIFYVTVEGTFTFVCVADGSTHVAGPFFGEAMDSADKATNKAMSASYKYMAMEVFCIPTEGDNDADATTHEVKPRRTESEPPAGSARGVAVAAFQELDPIARESLERRAQAIQEVYGRDGIVVAVDELHAMKLDNDQKLAIWSLFDSEFRSSIKREEQRRAQLKEAA